MMPGDNLTTIVGVGLLGAGGILALGFSLFGDGLAPRIGSAADVAVFLVYLAVILVAFVALALRSAD